MKAIVGILGLVFILCSCSANQTVMTSGVDGSGLNGTSYDQGLDNDTNADPDGVVGNASTYGTGTGVSGQTPSGVGQGTGNTGKSGVGVQRPIETK